MITKHQYIAALDVVEKYHKQLDLLSSIDSYKVKKMPVNIFVGALITCVQFRVNGGKFFTIGKKYEVLSICTAFLNYPIHFFIKDDRGKKIELTTNNIVEREDKNQKLLFKLEPRTDIEMDVLDDCFDLINKLAEKKAYQIINLIKQKTMGYE